MPVTQELVDQINSLQQQNGKYSSEQIIEGISRNPKYKDVTDQITALGDKHSPDQILEGIKQSPSLQKPTETKPKESQWSNLPGNIVPSAVRDAAGMVQGVVNLAGTFAGISQGEKASFDALKKLPKNVVDSLVQRYGSLAKLKETMINDPTGFALDVSTVLSGAGGLAKKGGELMASSSLAKTGEVLSKAGEVTNPIGLASKGALKATNAIAESTLPEQIYARAMKIPPASLNQPSRMRVVKTMVRDEKLPLGGGTVTNMNKIIKGLDEDIDGAISSASKEGEEMDIGAVKKSLAKLKTKYANRPDPQKYYDAIDQAESDLIDHDFIKRIKQQQAQTVEKQSPILNAEGKPFTSTQTVTKTVSTSTGKLSLEDAHDLKKGIYQEIDDYYMKQQKPETGKIGIRNDIDSAAKAEAAKTLRQAVIDNPNIPNSVKIKMKRESGLMNARKWVERATNRGGNLDPISISGMMFGVMVEGGVPAATAFAITTSQPVMSRLAIMLAKTRTVSTGFVNRATAAAQSQKALPQKTEQPETTNEP